MKKIFNYICNQTSDFIFKLFNEPITKCEYVAAILLLIAIAIRFILF